MTRHRSTSQLAGLRALVYVRVSTDGQERDGTSLETQERACREYAERSGWVVTYVIRDTASGFSLERPGLERLRSLLQAGANDVVLAYAVDRLSRNQNHIGVLFDEAQRGGARLEFVTERFEDNAVGRFILAARAFVAEVEREKILERTTRGKAERARSGRLPQATGTGIYGYRYNPASGKREVNIDQAGVIRSIYARYLTTRSFSAISRSLNDEGVPAFCGGRWYPLTVRSILTNEAYTGRTIFGRTRRDRLRPNRAAGSTSARAKTMVVERPQDEWIEIPGATPRIVDQEIWDRVSTIIADPERTRQRPASRNYLLRSRAHCGICGSAMVGQTLTVKGKPYGYYRCRHAYDKTTGTECSARYVRGPELESAVMAEVQSILSEPAIVLQELERARLQQGEGATQTEERTEMEREARALGEREKRLVRLFALGDVDEAIVREELSAVRRRREAIEAKLHAMEPAAPQFDPAYGPDALDRVCGAVRDWLDRSGQDGQMLALEALQVSVEATQDRAVVRGVIPGDASPFISDEASCRCSCSGSVAARVRVG